MSFKNFLVKNYFSSLILRNISRSYNKVLVYHRFSEEPKYGFTSVALFEEHLKYISKYYRVINLEEYIIKKKTGHECKNEIVITVDDGYHDFYEFAFPLLKKYQFPVTLFVTLDFVNQKIWMWWDLICYILKENQKGDSEFAFENIKVSIRKDKNAFEAWDLITNHCLKVENTRKWRLIQFLANNLSVEIPSEPVPEYSAINIEQIRELIRYGISIGAHTKTHPILTKLNSKLLKEEIESPKLQLESALGISINTFSYPNGQPEDLDDSVIKAVKDAGYIGAVVGYDDFTNKFKPFTISRFGVSEDLIEFIWKLYGGEILMSKIKKFLTEI